MHFRQMQAAELGERCTLYHKVGKVAGMAGKPQPSRVATSEDVGVWEKF